MWDMNYQNVRYFDYQDWDKFHLALIAMFLTCSCIACSVATCGAIYGARRVQIRRKKNKDGSVHEDAEYYDWAGGYEETKE